MLMLIQLQLFSLQSHHFVDLYSVCNKLQFQDLFHKYYNQDRGLTGLQFDDFLFPFWSSPLVIWCFTRISQRQYIRTWSDYHLTISIYYSTVNLSRRFKLIQSAQLFSDHLCISHKHQSCPIIFSITISRWSNILITPKHCAF